MSSKEDGSKDKKTKKKKSLKPTEEKAKEDIEEPVAEEENVTKVAEQQPTENQKTEQSANVEEDIEKSLPESIEKSTPVVSATRSTTENIKKDRKPSKVEDNRGSRKKEKDEIKRMDLEKLSQLKEAFSLFDFNHDGIIDLQDLKYTFASMGSKDFPEETMQKMLNEATEPVDFDAFVALFGYKVSALDSEDVFSKALGTWDMRGVGMIPEERLKRDIQCFGDKFSGKDTDSALEEAPVYVNEGASMIDYLKFSNNICGFQNVEKTRRYQKEIENAQSQK